MQTLTQDTPVVPGLNTYTMNMGRVVPVEVLSLVGDGGWMGLEWNVRYTGDTAVCLDMAQNWYLLPGDTFRTHKVSMDSALEWLAEKY